MHLGSVLGQGKSKPRLSADQMGFTPSQVELGVEKYKSIRSFGSAAVSVQAGNKVRRV